MRSKVLNCLPVFFTLVPVLSFGLLLRISDGHVQSAPEAYADEGKNERGKSGQMNQGNSAKQDEYDRQMDQLDAEKTRKLRKIEDEYTRELGKADDDQPLGLELVQGLLEGLLVLLDPGQELPVLALLGLDLAPLGAGFAGQRRDLGALGLEGGPRLLELGQRLQVLGDRRLLEADQAGEELALPEQDPDAVGLEERPEEVDPAELVERDERPLHALPLGVEAGLDRGLQLEEPGVEPVGVSWNTPAAQVTARG